MASGNSTQSVILCVEQRAQCNHGRALIPTLGQHVRGPQQERIGPLDPDPPSRGDPDRGHTSPVESTPSARPRVFYGWFIVAAATMASAIQSAVFNVGAQALVLPLERDLAASRTAITGAFSLSRLEGGVTGPIEGYLIHWIGPRRYMMGGWVIFGVGFILLGMSQNLYHFYASFLLITLGQSIAGFLPIVTVLVNWFYRWRGRAIAIYQLGGSIGALLVPVLSWFILNVGWRETTIAIGIGTIIIGVPRLPARWRESRQQGCSSRGRHGGYSRGHRRATPHCRPIPPRRQLLVPGPFPLSRDNRLGRPPGPPDTGDG